MRRNITATSAQFIVDEETDEAGGGGRPRAVIGGLVAGKTVKTTRTNQLMAFITLEDLLGPVEVIVFPEGLRGQPGPFTEDSKLFIREEVSIGDDPVGKLVCEQVIPLTVYPRSCGSSSRIWRRIGRGAAPSDICGPARKGPVAIYPRRRGAKKVLPANWNVGHARAFGRAREKDLMKNVKVVEKVLKSWGK